MTDFGTIAAWVAPILTGIASYFAGSRKRNNDFLADMQKSIDLLSAKNTELLDEVVKLRSENAKLLSNQDSLQYQVDKLTRQNEKLQKEVEELNTKLENVKTITKMK